ncbi:four helix bundle protein [Cyanobacterium aponinum UTEX 3222]|uniref:four helix bundle protein n=1 Tax=Cyanobacterium aponinum TaxID=379064 RepID=UPI0030916135|nr:four helix bundle protein [Cyanobacterium aponinum UTEX 3222]
MIELKSYRDLTVWQKSMDLVVICYQLTSLFPKTEIYGLSSQIQRAAVSIPANIAEGKGRNHLGDYPSFVKLRINYQKIETIIL